MEKKVFVYDLIRALAIIMVICIHSLGMLADAYKTELNEFGTAHWCGALWHIINNAVPLFIMLSGALLLGKQESISSFFKKRLTRVLIPFVVWTILLGVMLFFNLKSATIIQYTIKGRFMSR